MTESKCEEWRWVVGYEGFYEVSNMGRVKSYRRPTPRLLSPRVNASGHIHVALCVDKSRTERLVHRLVLEAFVGPAPDGMEGCHADGNPENNTLENLRWDTRAANRQDAIRHGTLNNGNATKTHCKRNHPFDEENTIWTKEGRRNCLTCRTTRSKKMWAEKKAAGT